MAASMRNMKGGDGRGWKGVPRAGAKEHGVDSLGMLPEKTVNLDPMGMAGTAFRPVLVTPVSQ